MEPWRVWLRLDLGVSGLKRVLHGPQSPRTDYEECPPTPRGELGWVLGVGRAVSEPQQLVRSGVMNNPG